MTTRSLVLALIIMLPSATAAARPQATVSSGIALALADYETHGIGFPVRAGADLPLLQTGSVRHHLLLTAEYAHFSRSFITEPEPLPGVQLDVGSVRGTWRLFPLPRRGLHVETGIGISLLRDRLRMALPGRRVTSSRTLVGLPLEVGLGWTIGRQVDLDLRYSHTVPVTGDTSSFLGQLGLGVGVRL